MIWMGDRRHIWGLLIKQGEIVYEGEANFTAEISEAQQMMQNATIGSQQETTAIPRWTERGGGRA